MIFTIIGAICSLAAFVCWIIILIDAFKSAWWKGLLCIITCGLYTLYYGIVEFQHNNKWAIVLTYLLGGVVGAVISRMGMGATPAG